MADTTSNGTGDGGGGGGTSPSWGSCHSSSDVSHCGSGMTPVTSDFGSIPAAMGMLIREAVTASQYQPWVFSILASILIGLAGILPLLVIPIEAGNSLKTGAGARTLKLQLSFAVGSLLGDVFLHLLPEAWNHLQEGSQDPHNGHMRIGLWVLAGIFVFNLIEMLVQRQSEEEEEQKDVVEVSHRNGKATLNNNVAQKRKPDFTNGCCNHDNSHVEYVPETKASQKQIAGYLNLVANSIDNFAHGLAVAGSFLVGPRVGLITTAAILLHEVPHELGDFAILLRAGFDRWAAARAQLATATVGILGALAALNADDCHALSDKTAWILPFTAGGFINIALVNVLPDLLKEDDPRESVKQLGSLLGGVAVIALVTFICV